MIIRRSHQQSISVKAIAIIVSRELWAIAFGEVKGKVAIAILKFDKTAINWSDFTYSTK